MDWSESARTFSGWIPLPFFGENGVLIPTEDGTASPYRLEPAPFFLATLQSWLKLVLGRARPGFPAGGLGRGSDMVGTPSWIRYRFSETARWPVRYHPNPHRTLVIPNPKIEAQTAAGPMLGRLYPSCLRSP